MLINMWSSVIWINVGHKAKVWTDREVKHNKQAFMSGLSTALRNPAGKGKRLTIVHTGSEKWFVDRGLWIFEAYFTLECGRPYVPKLVSENNFPH